jgi:hypothetical protein
MGRVSVKRTGGVKIIKRLRCGKVFHPTPTLPIKGRE